MFKELHELSFTTYIMLSGRADAIMLLFSLIVLLCIFLFIGNKAVKYIFASIFTVANTIGLITGIVLFSMYETTMQKSMWTDEIAAELFALVKSMMSEVPIYLFIALAVVTASVIVASLILSKRTTSKKWHLWPLFAAIILTLCIVFTGRESQLLNTAKSITAMNEKQAFTTLREISMNPNFNILFEKNYNKKQNISNIETLGDFSFGLNTDSLEIQKRKERINILPRGRKYNIIIYLFESTHNSRLDMQIDGRSITPTWQRLMKNGIRARNHYANYPLSANALLSVLSSAYAHPGRELILQKYPKAPLKTIPETLRKQGYKSLIIHSSSLNYVNQIEFLKDRFDTIIDGAILSKMPPYNYTVGWGLDERVMTSPIIDFIKECGSNPFFVTVMPINPHHPYSIPEKNAIETEFFRIAGRDSNDETRRSQNITNYLNSLHYADAALGHLVDALEENNMMENTLLFVIADHGEAFYEHKGNYNHPFFIYDENVHVPFVIYNKSLITRPIDIYSVTRHIDVFATIEDLLNIDSSPMQEGVSILSGGREQLAPLHTNYRYDFLGIRDGKWKYIRRMTDSFEELYDLNTDPQEAKNISDIYPDISKRYRDFTDKYRTYSIAYYNKVLEGMTPDKHKNFFDVDEMTFEEYQEAKNKKNLGEQTKE